MKPGDRTKLLFGPYQAPRLRKGDRATCLYKDCDVVVTGWTDARISWPRCRPLAVPRSHPSLLVDEELARAVRHESAAALRYWWGVSVGVVWRWRKALGADRLNCPGSQRLIRQASEQGAAQVRGKRLTPEAGERRRRTALAQGLARNLVPALKCPPSPPVVGLAAAATAAAPLRLPRPSPRGSFIIAKSCEANARSGDLP
jgi:hypothetical protein